MKKIILSTILVVIPLWTFFYLMAEPKLEFDKKLENYLQEELQELNLSKQDVLSIEKLNLSDRNLTSVKGLEHFKNLKELNLSNNNLTDSSFLEELNKLEELNLNYNQLKELKINSPKLKSLKLRGNRLDSIKFISSLSQLTSLNIRDNNIQDITPLSNLNSLVKLNIRGNQIKSLKPLEDKLELKDLNARNNQINSIEPIKNLSLEQRLYISGNSIKDIHLLSDRAKYIQNTDYETGIPKPVFKQNSGVYNQPFKVELETDDDYDIYYTLDGSIPKPSSTKYEGPIELSEELMHQVPIISNHKTSPLREGYSFEPGEVKKAITITAIATKKWKNYSDPVTATYILDESLFNSSLPVISLTVDPQDLFNEHEGIYVQGSSYYKENNSTGNYYLKGRENEKNANIEIFDERGSLKLQQDIGIRINGGWSRRLPQKSLRLYARSDYGQSRLFTNIFDDLPYNEFNLLLLRNSGNDYNSTFMRDGLMHELIKGGNVDVQAYQPSLLLINGEYWGLHNIREKFNKDYIDIKYNVNNKDLVLMKGYKSGESVNFDMKAGSQKDELHYRKLLDFVEKNEMNEIKNIEQVKKMMDIENFLEYVSYQVYYANTDSFSNNIMLWRKNVDYSPNAPQGHDGRWRWMLFDLDWGMGLKVPNYDGDPVTYNMIDHMLQDEERMILFKSLMENEDIKEKFIVIMLKLLNDNFEPSNVKDKIDELSSAIRPEIPHTINRWEAIQSIELWEDNLTTLYAFAEKRPDFIKQHIITTMDISEEELKRLEKQVLQKQ